MVGCLLGLLCWVQPAHSDNRPNDPEFYAQWNLQSRFPAALRVAESWDPQWRWIANNGGNAYLSDLEPDGTPVDGPRLVRMSGQYLGQWKHTYGLMNSGDVNCNATNFRPYNFGNLTGSLFCEVAIGWTQTRLDWSRDPFKIPAEGAWVRFGWGDRFVYQFFQHGTFECRPSLFPPIDDVLAPICQVQRRLDGGGVVADEGGAFTVRDSDRVRYGAEDVWTSKTLLEGQHTCEPRTFTRIDDPMFSGDPAVGVRKHCEVVRTMGHGAVVAVLGDGTVPHPDTPPIAPRMGFNRIPFLSTDNDAIRDLGTAANVDACPSNEPEKFVAAKSKGIIVANVGNRRYGAGIAPDADIIDVRWDSCARRAYGDQGVRARFLADAILWSVGEPISRDQQPGEVGRPARVIVVTQSYLGACPPDVQDAIDRAWKENAVVVAPVGKPSPGLLSPPTPPTRSSTSPPTAPRWCRSRAWNGTAV